MHTYMHMYLLEFGLKQTLSKVLDPTTAMDFAIHTYFGYEVHLWGFMAPYSWYILYIPCNCH